MVRRCSVKKVLLDISQNPQENICVRFSFLIKLQDFGLQLDEKGTLAQVFSCEFCEILKNTFFIEHLGCFLTLGSSLVKEDKEDFSGRC